MSKHKGIGGNEVSTAFSFYAPFGTDTKNQSWGWFKTVQEAVKGTQNLARTWDNDNMLIGYSACPFTVHGGGCVSSSGAGILYSSVTSGSEANTDGFRSVLII